MSKIDNRTRALVRDLTALGTLVEELDRVGGLEQAIAERTAQINALTNQVEQAKAEAARVIAEVTSSTDKKVEEINAKVNLASLELRDKKNELTEADLELTALQVKIADADAKLKATQDALASIAANIGG